MAEPQLRPHPRPNQHMCGIFSWSPAWLQPYATTKSFMAVYGLLGTIQAMAYMYFIVTLTTIEKRFKIPSQTTGIILSGNEISQILLSLILSYVGGQRDRPRWIAWGIVFCGASCFILALPHFIYGAGDEVLRLTQEHFNSSEITTSNGTIASALVRSSQKSNQYLCRSAEFEQECDQLLSIVPLALIFLSQFVLGIGNTLYYSLGQTYLDDNTKKTNTPLMLAVAMAMRMIGPIIGFFLGYISLNMFIDPTKTPIIDNKDPRWLGAWWFGWVVLGTLMVLFSGLIGLFPRTLPTRQHTKYKYNSHMPQALRNETDVQLSEPLPPLGRGFSSTASISDFPKLEDFPRALMRLLRNKLLIFNIISGIFYILGATGYMTFLTKYMEVQFHRNAQSATIVVGPVSIMGMITGLIGSGVIISKKKPSPSKVLMWNVIVGGVYVVGQISYMFMYCEDPISLSAGGGLNISTACNSNCSCGAVPYSPICHEPTKTTYFSPCHAGCQSWVGTEKVYSNCSCLTQEFPVPFATTPSLDLFNPSNTDRPMSTVSENSTMYSTTTTTIPTTLFVDEATFTISSLLADKGSSERVPATRQEPPINQSFMDEALKPGVCLEGCDLSFWIFSAASMVIHWFGASGRIGNLLVNYRAVATEDKSFAQGLSLMLVSLFALIPGPIIFGRIIDSTCLIWTKTCNGNGNCQLYDQAAFRFLVNAVAFSLTAFGMMFDILVWYYGRHLDLYGERETERKAEIRRRNKPITPLLARK